MSGIPAGSVEVIDAEIVEADTDLTAAEAEQITNRIRRWVNAFPADDVARAFRGRIWITLAYDSWAEWCECELGGFKLPIEQRREAVAELAEAGMSNVAIAEAVGVTDMTVMRDRRATASTNVDPEPLREPRPVLGQDGKSYAPPVKREPPQPQSEPPAPAAARRKPLADTARDLGLDLAKITNRLQGLASDDRLARNRNEVAPRLRHHLDHAIKVCQDLNHQLTQGV